MSHQMTRLRLCSGLMGLVLLTACNPRSCNNTGPGGRVRWTSYPALATSTTSFPWLVVKCRIADVAAIPAGLDTSIQQFFGISGAGFGNIVDYFHDVSYNRVSVISDTIVGWNPAPFNTGDLSFPNGRLAPASTRAQRVKECLNAIPAQQRPDFEAFYGVVVVNNAVQDGGACYTGQQPIAIGDKSFNLACLWFDPNSLFTGFASHEVGHGLGLDHSFDDSQRNCGGQAGEYCDPFDVMSALGTYRFPDTNWLIGGNPSGAGPGLDAAALLRQGWIPSDNIRRFQNEGDEQIFTLRALSHARAKEPLVVLLDVGSETPFEGVYAIEYRQADGWDAGFAKDVNAPATVRASQGTVLVHQFRAAGAPASRLINGAFAGALQPFDTMILTGVGGVTFHVRVLKFDTANGSATVSIGFGRGIFVPKPGDTVKNVFDGPGHVHTTPGASTTVKP
jgi:hypothetical protein